MPKRARTCQKNGAEAKKYLSSGTEEQSTTDSVSVISFCKSLTDKYDEVTIKTVSKEELQIEYEIRKTPEEMEKPDLYWKKRTRVIKPFPKENTEEPFSNKKLIRIKLPQNSPAIVSLPPKIDIDIDAIIRVLQGDPTDCNVIDAYVMSVLEEYNAKFDVGIFKTFEVKPTLDFVSVRFLQLTERSTLIHKRPNFFYPLKNDLKNSLVFAPLYTFGHFYLALYNFPEREILIYDSLKHYQYDDIRFHDVLQLFNNLIARMDFDDSLSVTAMLQGWRCVFKHGAQQTDSSSCGYFVIKFLHDLLNGEPEKCSQELDQNDLVKIRRMIVKRVLSLTDNGRSFLKRITR